MFQTLEELAAKEYFTHIDDVKVPAGYGKTAKGAVVRKKKVDLSQMEGEIGVKYAEPMNRYSSEYSCKFVEKTIQVKDLKKQPHLHVYGVEGQRALLDKLYVNTGGDKRADKVIPVILTERAIEVVKALKLHNFMDIAEFYKGKHRNFRKMITAFIIQKDLLENYSKIFDYATVIKKYLCTPFGQDLLDLEKFASAYSPDCGDDFMNDLVQIAHDGKLYDAHMWEKYNTVKDDIAKFDFVGYFYSDIHAMDVHLDNKSGTDYYTAPGKQAVKVMREVARYRKIHMDWKHYLLLENTLVPDAQTV
jgi:hypothetical protein